MTHRTKRCKHCGVTYYFQASGRIPVPAFNDDTYCPTCKAAVERALSSIPVRWSCDFHRVEMAPAAWEARVLFEKRVRDSYRALGEREGFSGVGLNALIHRVIPDAEVVLDYAFFDEEAFSEWEALDDECLGFRLSECYPRFDVIFKMKNGDIFAEWEHDRKTGEWGKHWENL